MISFSKAQLFGVKLETLLVSSPPLPPTCTGTRPGVHLAFTGLWLFFIDSISLSPALCQTLFLGTPNSCFFSSRHESGWTQHLEELSCSGSTGTETCLNPGGCAQSITEPFLEHQPERPGTQAQFGAWCIAVFLLPAAASAVSWPDWTRTVWLL